MASSPLGSTHHQLHPPLHPPSVERYAASAAILVGGILVQYLPIFPAINNYWLAELLGALITYGPGLVAFFVLIGTQPVRNAFRRNREGAKEGLRWYGVLGLLSIVVVVVLAGLYLTFDPNYQHLVNKETSVDEEGIQNPVAWMLLSFPIGLVEETLFRGFLFGGALLIFGTSRWKLHALWTSLLFAGVHLYYAQVYLEISPLDYVQLFLLGLAFAFAYFKSGGNLLVVALLHGGYDATSFASFLPAVGDTGAAVLKFGFLGACGLWALFLYVRESEQAMAKEETTRTPLPPGAAWPPPSPLPPSPAPPSEVAWAMADAPPAHIPAHAYPGGTPGIPPVPGLVIPTPEMAGTPPPPPAPPSPVASSPPTSPSEPTPHAAFVPPLCPGCGAIVMGDLTGIPPFCPRCHAPLFPRLVASPSYVPLPLQLSATPVHQVPAIVPTIERGSHHALPRTSEGPQPLEDLPAGAWPPEEEGSLPFPRP